MRCGFAYISPYTLGRGLPSPRGGYLPASPHCLPTTGLGRALHANGPKTILASGAQHHRTRYGRFFAGTGISTRCPSTTPVGLALGPDSPWADWPGPGTLGLSAGKVLTCLIATHACILTPPRSTIGHPMTSLPEGRSPTQPYGCRGFGGVLEPRYIVGARSLDQ